MTKIFVCDPFSDFVEITMSGATSIKYAAARAAEACGYDEEAFWWLSDQAGSWLPEDAVIAEYDGSRLLLTPRAFGEL